MKTAEPAASKPPESSSVDSLPVVNRQSIVNRQSSIVNQLSASLRVRSFSKINLALSVLGRRGDGYHEIRTVFQTIDLHDELEFRPSRTVEFRCADLPDVPVQENLVWRAATTLARRCRVESGAEVTLRKRIPPGSGLGGGSANAAATLLGLCRFWNLDIPMGELQSLAAELGADVPFFLHGGTALGIGRGEEIYPLPAFPAANLAVVIPPVRIATVEAYRSLKLELTSFRPAHKIQRFCSQLREGASCLAGIFNDFETSILPAYPAVRKAKSFLIERGATAAMLSGSGSAVFGFFIDEESALAASRAADTEAWLAFPAKTLASADYFRHMFG